MNTAFGRSVVLRIALTVVAVAAAVALASVAFGLNGWLRLGPLGLRVNNPSKPLAWGVVAGTVVLFESNRVFIDVSRIVPGTPPALK